MCASAAATGASAAANRDELAGFIDFFEPEQSALLRYGVSETGGDPEHPIPAAAMDADSADYAAIVAWIRASVVAVETPDPGTGGSGGEGGAAPPVGGPTGIPCGGLPDTSRSRYDFVAYQNGVDAMILIVLANAWKMVAYNFIFFLAGLQSIPRTMVEAGAMDGAGVLRRMVDIQLPLLAPTFFFLVIINLTESFVDSFGIVDITTGGGPARATDLMVYKIYADGFMGKDYSLAAAQSIVLMLLVMALTFVQFKYVERRIHYA